MKHKFTASVKPSWGYGVSVHVDDLPVVSMCQVGIFSDSSGPGQSTDLTASELDALILALQGARAMLQPTK